MGKVGNNSGGGRDWPRMYSIYGVEQWQTVAFLALHGVLFAAVSVAYLAYFSSAVAVFSLLLLPGAAAPAARFAAGFTGAVAAISAACLFFAAANFLHSSVALRHDMAQRMVGAVGDWSTVRHALDLGCGRGILLNAVATQLKKGGSSGRVVGLDRTRGSATLVSTLRTARLEGVAEYVTCREGDARRLPFGDNYFDVVVSAVFVHTVGREHGPRTAAAAAERMRAVGELVRVLKPGGRAVVWDLQHVPEYVRRLQELRMEDVRVSEPVTAFMASSHIVSFRKPSSPGVAGTEEVRLDWRC